MFKKTYTWAFILGFIGILSGCASTYMRPTKNEPAATVAGSKERQGLATWKSTAIDSIDSKSVGLVMSANSKLRVYPGKHNIVAVTQFNRGIMSGGPYDAITDVDADFKPYHNYVVKSAVKGSKIQTWIEDENGQRVSPIKQAPYRVSPRQQTVIVPIVTH